MTYGWSGMAVAERWAREAAVDRIMQNMRRMDEQVLALAPLVDDVRTRAQDLRDPIEMRMAFEGPVRSPFRERFPCMLFRERVDAPNDRKARAAAYAKGAG